MQELVMWRTNLTGPTSAIGSTMGKSKGVFLCTIAKRDIRRACCLVNASHVAAFSISLLNTKRHTSMHPASTFSIFRRTTVLRRSDSQSARNALGGFLPTLRGTLILFSAYRDGPFDGPRLTNTGEVLKVTRAANGALDHNTTLIR